MLVQRTSDARGAPRDDARLMARPSLYGLALAAVAASSVAIVAAEAGQRAPVTYTIVIDQMAFGAAPSGLHVGDTIVWVNRDLFRHTATATDHSFDIDLVPGKSARVRLAHAGNVTFSCSFHPDMRGSLAIAP
jgi:plastocyanin